MRERFPEFARLMDAWSRNRPVGTRPSDLLQISGQQEDIDRVIEALAADVADFLAMTQKVLGKFQHLPAFRGLSAEQAGAAVLMGEVAIAVLFGIWLAQVGRATFAWPDEQKGGGK
ncbi:MAG: hypothetical protein ACREKK_01440 [Candidatus Methylomirabilales bacterium]